jgi:hypothetical protein
VFFANIRFLRTFQIKTFTLNYYLFAGAASIYFKNGFNVRTILWGRFRQSISTVRLKKPEGICPPHVLFIFDELYAGISRPIKKCPCQGRLCRDASGAALLLYLRLK